MAQQLQILLTDSHNLALLISPPPESQKQFAFSIHGFNTCKISRSLRMNPVIHENLVEESWLPTKINKYGDDNELIEGILSKMGYEGVYLMLQKKILIPSWRYIPHLFMVCMSGNKGSFDMLNKEQTSAFVALSMNWGFNFSKFILNEMKGNLRGSRSERFMMYPRFLQMFFDERFPNLQRGVVNWDLKLLSESTFPLMMQNRGGKYKFEGLHPLKKFGQFAETEGVDVGEVAEIPNAVIEEEHDVQVLGSKSSDEDIYVVQPPEYEAVVTGYEPDMDFDFETDTVLVESESPEQMSLFTAENLEPLLEHVKSSVSTIAVEPTEPVPRFIESTAGPSSHTEDVDYDSFLVKETRTRADKGKYVLPDDEPIDVVKLQSRLLELEQDSLSHTLLIRDLKIENEAKDRKIKDLKTNMGHLSAIVLDMKQKLQEKFKGEFHDESSSSTIAEPDPEMSRADFNEFNRS
ncbi:hypothetical protein R6Q57_013236 [Mikania cordata]